MKKVLSYKHLVQKKYLDFFADSKAIYMYEDGIHQPYYIGTAMEFVSAISDATLPVDYDDLYSKVFKGKKWLYIDTLSKLSDEFVSSLTSTQIITIFAAMRHKELFCTGFIKGCGKAGIIYRFLNRLKVLSEQQL